MRRTALLAGAAALGMAVLQAAAPQKIVFTRVFPNHGQIGLFIAARDASRERTLPASWDVDYDPAWSSDGRSIVFTSDREGSDDQAAFSPPDVRTGGGDGLEIMNIGSGAATTLTKGYDNFPLWSPRGDLIMFSRLADGDYDVYTIHPDGTGLTRLTHSHGNDAHQAWSPDGDQIVFASSRMGFKDESIYTDAPQPYGEVFVMKADGTNVRQLTDNQWEDGTPAWQPSK